MKNLDRILDNAFKAVRIESKRKTQFYSTEYHRPVTQRSVYDILWKNEIEISMRDFNDLMINYKYAEDYHTSWKSEVTLIIRSSGAELRFQRKGANERVSFKLKKDYLRTVDFQWSDLFSDASLFTSDFEVSTLHSDKYYTAKDNDEESEWKKMVLLLKEIAESKGITQNEISNKTKLLQSNISRFFSLKYKPTLDTFLQVAKAIKVNFFFEDQEEKTDLNLAFERAMTELGRRRNNLPKN